MNIQNFEYLRNQLFYCGFGHKLEDALRSKMAKDKQEFQLQYRGQIDSEPVRAELHFSRSRQTDRYYFNSFRVENAGCWWGCAHSPSSSALQPE